MQADHRVPAALVRRGQVLDEAGRLDPLVVGDVGVRAQHVGEVGRGRRVVVFVGPRQGDDQPSGHVVGDAVHLVDLVGEEQLADVREDRVRHDDARRLVFGRVDARGDAAGIEAFDDGDELHHLFAQVRLLAGVEAVGLAHQRARADQQVAEAGPGRDARLPVVRGVAVREERRVLPLAGKEHALPRHEDLVEDDDAGRLAVLVREQRRLLAGPPGRPRDDGDAVGIAGNGAADREVGVGLAHVAAGHDEEFVHVGRAGHDRLGPGNDDAPAVALDDVHVAVDVGLLVRPLAAVALRVGHADADAQVLVLEIVQVGHEPLLVVRALVGVDARRRHDQGAEGVVHEIALGAAGLLAEDAHGLELVEEVGAAGVGVQHAVDGLAARRLHRQHDGRELAAQCHVVGDADRVDAGHQLRRVGDALDRLPVDPDPRLVAAQRLPVLPCVHQHAVSPRIGSLPLSGDAGRPTHCREGTAVRAGLGENPELAPTGIAR